MPKGGKNAVSEAYKVNPSSFCHKEEINCVFI